MRNFSPEIEMQISEIIALPSFGKIATWLHCALVKLADKKFPGYSGLSIFFNSLEVSALPS